MIDWQLRSQDLSKIKDKIQSFRAVIEERFVDAFDEKYHRDEWREMQIEQEDFCLNEDPRKKWLTIKANSDMVNGE